MSTLIKQRRIVEDSWRVFGLPHEPAAQSLPRDGDIVVIYGQPKALEHAESVLLAG